MKFALLLYVMSLHGSAAPPAITVAVASNFRAPAVEIAKQFEQASGIRVKLVSGSTGKLFAQISNGAPFDVFLAADAARPDRLVDMGLATNPLVYAKGKLIYWASDQEGDASTCRANLVRQYDELFAKSEQGPILAIANPRTAPYGAATTQVLARLDARQIPADQLVTGENIAQTFVFVDRGGAASGFVAASMQDRIGRGCIWPVPTQLHDPIKQVGVQLTSTRLPTESTRFLNYLKLHSTQALLRRAGYE